MSVFGTEKFFISVIMSDFQSGFSAGYESGKYRTTHLASLMVRGLPDFALSPEEAKTVNVYNAAQKLNEAARTLYNAPNPNARGEGGELILHIILRDLYGTIPAISKIYFTDSANENVKGFDLVHVKKVSGSNMEIWVGESKLSANFDTALESLRQDISKHSSDDFLRQEFLFIKRKLDKSFEEYERFLELVSEHKSLDAIAQTLRFIAFATYDCEVTKKHQADTTEFITEIREDLKAKLQRVEKLFGSSKLKFGIILLPLFSRDELRKEFDAKLAAAQKI